MILVTGGTPDRGRGSGRIPARWTKNAGPATRCRSPAAASSNDPRWRWPAAHCSRARAARSSRTCRTPRPRSRRRWPIKRVVYLMLENRSFDNLFGRFPGVEGTTIGVLDGAEVPLERCPDWLPGDLPHDRAAALNYWNDGKHGRVRDRPPTAIRGPTRSSTGTRCPTTGTGPGSTRSRITSSRPRAGPSYPNHFFFIAGTSGGAIDNPENIKTEPRWTAASSSRAGDATRSGTTSSCSRSTSTVNLAKHDSCFDFRTVGEQLTHRGVDWTFYSAAPGTPGYFWNAYNGVGQVFHTDLWQEHTRDVETVIDDIAGREATRRHLGHPAVPALRSSPGELRLHAQLGQRSDRSIMKSDAWEQTAIFLTWDEWGGFYDHVPSGRRRSGRARLPGPVAHDQPVHRSRDDRRRAPASSPRRFGSSPTTGGSRTSPTGSRTRTTSSTSSTSRSRRAHPRSRGSASRPSDGSISSRRTIPGPREPSPTRRRSEAQPPPIGFGTYRLTRLRAFRIG